MKQIILLYLSLLSFAFSQKRRYQKRQIQIQQPSNSETSQKFQKSQNSQKSQNALQAEKTPLFPVNLPDSNQDGYSDTQDFQRAFSGLSLTRFEISVLFEIADTQRSGKISQVEWTQFHNLFVMKFEEMSKGGLGEGLVAEEKVEQSLNEFQRVGNAIKNYNQTDYVNKIMSVLTSRAKQEKLGLNLYEFIFLRRACIAWETCTANNLYITKTSIQTCAQQIMLPNIQFSDNQQQIFYHVLEKFSRYDDKIIAEYKFLSFLSIFHKYDLFQRINQNQVNSATINYNKLKQAITDNFGPNQRINHDTLQQVFGKEYKNLEFTGLDFKQFFILMQSVDFVYQFGNQNHGFINKEEFFTLLDSGVYHPNLIKNIDFCYVDKKEENEQQKVNDHSQELKLLAGTRRSQRLQKKKQAQKSNDTINMPREAIFNIFNMENNGQISGGQLFNFHKFSLIFNEQLKGSVHLIFQKNLDFDLSLQLKNYEISIFMEEQWQFTKLQKWMKDLQKYGEIGINFQQFASYFFYRQHFINQSQSSLTHNQIPFPAFKSTLEKLGFQLHKSDILNSITYEIQPNIVHSLKYDTDSYMKDGAMVEYDEVFHKCLLRYSKAMMQALFQPKENNGKKDRRIRKMGKRLNRN